MEKGREESRYKTKIHCSLIKWIIARCLSDWWWTQQSCSGFYYAHCSDVGLRLEVCISGVTRICWCSEKRVGALKPTLVTCISVSFKKFLHVYITCFYQEPGDTFSSRSFWYRNILKTRATAASWFPFKNTEVLPGPVSGATGLKTPTQKPRAQTRN